MPQKLLEKVILKNTEYRILEAINTFHATSLFLYPLKKAVGKNFAKGLQLYKKETLAHVFPFELCEIFLCSFFIEHLWKDASRDILYGSFERNWLKSVLWFSVILLKKISC